MRIGNGKAIYIGRIAVNLGSFLYRIDNSFPVFVFRKILPCVLPVISLCNSNRISICFAVCIQLYLYALRTDAILIAAVLPSFGYGNINGLRFMGICDGRTIYARLISIGDIDFVYRILDLYPILILRKVLDCIPPAVCRCNSNRVAVRCAVCIQLYLYTLRTDAVLIVAVNPLFGYSKLCCCRCMAVGNGKAVFVRRVARWHIDFLYRIDDSFAFFVLRQVCPCIRPAVCRFHFNRVTVRCTICIQLYCHIIRTETVLIVAVIPCLGYRDGRCFRNVRIGNGKAIYLRGITCRYTDFLYCIDNRFSCFVFRQVRPCVLPVIRRCNSNRVTVRCAVCIQLYLHAPRTDAILIVAVIPCLGYRDGRCLRLVYYCIVADARNSGFSPCHCYRNRISGFIAVWYCFS